MTRELLGVLVLAWLAGVFVGWCGGWIARGEQNRGWRAGVVRQLAAARGDLAQARADLAEVCGELEWVRVCSGGDVPQLRVDVAHAEGTGPGTRVYLLAQEVHRVRERLGTEYYRAEFLSAPVLADRPAGGGGGWSL